jgi:hypothetical protein
MFAQEHAFYARQATAKEGREEVVETGCCSLWYPLQAVIVALFLMCFGRWSRPVCHLQHLSQSETTLTEAIMAII